MPSSKKTMSGLEALQSMKGGSRVSILDSNVSISYTMNETGAVLSHGLGSTPVHSGYPLQWFLDRTFIDTSTVKHITPLEAVKIFAKNDGTFVYYDDDVYKVHNGVLLFNTSNIEDTHWRKSNLRYNEILSDTGWFLKQ